MQLLKESLELNELSAVDRGIKFLEAEYQEMLTQEVIVNEFAENTLNAILNDVERRIEAAKRGLAQAGEASDPAARKELKSRAMAHLNRTRSLLDKVANEFFPEKTGAEDGPTPNRDREEYVSPQQAAETLGISTGKLQSLVMANKLRMHNHNGKWALKGSEVQALADAPKVAAPTKSNFGDALKNTDFGKRLSSFIR